MCEEGDDEALPAAGKFSASVNGFRARVAAERS